MVAAVHKETARPNFESIESMLRKVFEGQTDAEIALSYIGAKSALDLSNMFACAYELHLREMEAE